MTALEQLQSTLDDMETKQNDFIKSHEAQKLAAKEGEDALKLEMKTIREENQKLHELAKRRTDTDARDDDGARALGENIVKCHKGTLTRAANEGTDTAGGHLVETEVTHSIRSVQNQFGAVRRLFGSNIVPMKSDVLTVPVDTFEVSGTSASGANVPTPVVTAENGAITESADAVLSELELTARKLATLNYISLELIQDAFVDFIGAYLMPKIARQFDKLEDQTVFTAATTGLLNHVSVPVVTLPAGQTSFRDVGSDVLLDMEDAIVDDAVNADPRYIGHRTVFNLVRKIKDNDGNPIWTPLAAGEPPSIHGWGYEKAGVFPNKAANEQKGKGFMLFGDVNLAAVVGERLTREMATSEHFRFNQYQLALRVVERFAFNTNANIANAISRLETATK